VTLYEQAQRFRADALRGERQAASALVRSYGVAYTRINRDIEALRVRVQQAKDAGERLSPSWAYQEGRLLVLRAKVLEQITQFAGEADIIVGGAIDTARTLGTDHAGRLLQAALPEGVSVAPSIEDLRAASPVVPESVRLAAGAIEQATALVQPQAALSTLLSSLGPDAATAVGDALVSGIATGKNPRVIAREMRQALGGNLTRALTIARTETLRAYREASRSVYRANADVVAGWVWTADLSNRTCASCWAQHGSVHPLDEIMATHPRCRCSMVPKTRSWRELGFGDTPEAVRIEEGPALFRRLAPDQQEAILGPAKFRAYRAKQITLPDVVAKRSSPVWGPSTSEAGLSAAKQNAAARRLGGDVAPTARPPQVTLAPTASTAGRSSGQSSIVAQPMENQATYFDYTPEMPLQRGDVLMTVWTHEAVEREFSIFTTTVMDDLGGGRIKVTNERERSFAKRGRQAPSTRTLNRSSDQLRNAVVIRPTDPRPPRRTYRS
jgi:SPP1 gp7 family putative phage head morphogenesis protein